MKKLFVLLLLFILTGCSEETLTFKSDNYGTSSKVVVYFEEGKASKAISTTVFKDEKSAKKEYDNIKALSIYSNIELNGKELTYEQTKYIKGMSKDKVKKLFKESK